MRTSLKRPWQRILAMVLCMAMLVSFLPVGTQAVGTAASQETVDPEPVQISDTAAEEPVTQEKQPEDVGLLSQWLEQQEEALEPMGLSGIVLPRYQTAAGLVSQTMAYDCGNGVTGDGSKPS